MYTVVAWSLVVLFLKSRRSTGHRFLCAAQKTESSVLSACLPSFHHMPILVGLFEIFARYAFFNAYFKRNEMNWDLFSHRWTRSCDRISKFVCAHFHVLLLYGGRVGSALPQISVVEEIYDLDPADPIHHHADVFAADCHFRL